MVTGGNNVMQFKGGLAERMSLQMLTGKIEDLLGVQQVTLHEYEKDVEK